MYVKQPDEDYEEGMCGRLNKVMYVTRDAAQNWEYEYGEWLKSVGFVSGRASPCVFYQGVKVSRARR